jgi:hypothetical protein
LILRRLPLCYIKVNSVEYCRTLARTFILSPGEKKLPFDDFRFATGRLANPVASFSGRREQVLPLPGGRGLG